MVDLPARKCWWDALAFKEGLWNELHIRSLRALISYKRGLIAPHWELLQRHILFIIVNYELFAKN